ncbi:MAG: hypothetical protein ACP5VP_09825 [Candidatus Limnocylindrales bacterium]|jgi:hypothetical protein
MPATDEPRITHVVRETIDDEADTTAAAVRQVDPDAALADYAELARLLRAADQAGDREAVVEIRELMDGIWPALTEEQKGRIEEGEFDW